MTETNTPETATQETEKKPFLTVLSGNPTPQQTAALTVLFAGLANGAAAASGPTGPRNQWGRYEDGFHRPTSYSPSSFMNVQFY